MRKLILILLLLSGTAAAQDRPLACAKSLDALACFIAVTNYSVMVCRLTYELAIVKGEDRRVSDALIKSSLDQMPPFYQRAAAQLAKKADASSQLKDYYAFWQSSMAGIPLRDTDTMTTWKKRLTVNEVMLDARSSRLALEK